MYDYLSEIDSLKYIMVVNQWIIIRVSHNTMDVIHGYQLTYCSYSWLSKIPWMLIMVNHGSYSFIVVSGGVDPRSQGVIPRRFKRKKKFLYDLHTKLTLKILYY